MNSLYRFCLAIIELLEPILKFIPHEKIRYFFQNHGKVQILKGSHIPHRPIWIHASSGEIEYAKPLIRELKKQFPQIPLLVTHTSLSSLKTLQSLDVEAIGVSPLDTPYAVRKFLSLTQPRACLISRTDLWPTTIDELFAGNIPTFLFSATFSSGMKKSSWLSQRYLKTAFSKLKRIYFVSQEDFDFAKTLYPHLSGVVLGDTRYDQVFHRLSQARALLLPPTPRLIVNGSTWEEDDRVLIPAAQDMKAQGYRWIWVPHEVTPSSLKTLQSQLENHQLRTVLFSQMTPDFSWQRTDVLLVDQVGLLASLYMSARWAFIGGSFRKQVHSVMEALAAGCPVVVGPHHQNNREALEFKSLGFVKDVKDELSLKSAFSEMVDQDSRSQLIPIVKSKSGATQALIKDLETWGLFSPSSV